MVATVVAAKFLLYVLSFGTKKVCRHSMVMSYMVNGRGKKKHCADKIQ
jgi:hypothetical protein